jgi:Ni/Fe-hydrogenase subunit HybB-like protein
MLRLAAVLAFYFVQPTTLAQVKPSISKSRKFISVFFHFSQFTKSNFFEIVNFKFEMSLSMTAYTCICAVKMQCYKKSRY